MKRFLSRLAVILTVTFVGALPVVGEETTFLSGIEDMPLMEGVREDVASLLVFESVAGRYVEAFADGAVSPAEVRDFYDAALPQLGWQKTAPLTYRREGEALVLETLDGAVAGSTTRIHFILSPVK